MDSDLLESSLLEYLNIHNTKTPNHNFYLENRIILSSPPSSPLQRFLRTLNTDITTDLKKELNSTNVIFSSTLNRETKLSAAPLASPPNYQVKIRSHYETEKHKKKKEDKHNVTSNPKRLIFMRDYGNPDAMFSKKYHLSQDVIDRKIYCDLSESEQKDSNK